MPPADGSAEQDDRVAVARVVLRPFGTPLPLGFLALAVATAGFSALQLDWLPPEQGRVVALSALLVTAPLVLLASVFGFLARDPVAGTGMALLAGTWGLTGYVALTSPPGTSSEGLGVVLVTAGAALLVPAAAGTAKLVAASVMTLTAVRFAVTGVYELTASPAWQTAAGVLGLVLVAAYGYAALGFELEGARRRTVLPLGRRGAAREALVPDVRQQLDGLSQEAGVRQQL